MGNVDAETDKTSQLRAEEAAKEAERFRDNAKKAANDAAAVVQNAATALQNAATALQNAATIAPVAGTARQSVSNDCPSSRATNVGLALSALTLIAAGAAVWVAAYQLGRMNTDSRVAFTQHLYADLSKKIESFVADEKVGQSFAVAKGVAFDPNSVPAAAGNRAIMIFNLYARYYALKQQSDGLISDRDWIEITNLLCGTLKDPPYAGSLAYLRSKNGTTSVSDAQTPGQPGAEGSRNQNGAKDIQTSQSSRGETEDALGDKALQQLETCKP